MKTLTAPKPIIAETVQTWRVAPGMIYALVRDIEKNVWIVESCPAGTHFWTLAQAANLPAGRSSRTAIQSALRAAESLTAAEMPSVPAWDYTLPTLPTYPEEPRTERRFRSVRTVKTAKTCVPA